MQQRCCASLVTACQQLARLKLQKLLSSNTMAKEMNFHQDCASARPSNLCQAAVAASKRIQTRQLPSHWQTTDRSVSQILQTQSKHQCRGHISASHNQSLLCKTPFRSLTCKSPSAAGSSSKLSATLGQRLCGQSGASMAAKHSGAPGKNTSTVAPASAPTSQRLTYSS